MESTVIPAPRFLSIVMLLLAAAPSAIAAPATAPASRPSIAALTATALGDDVHASIAALRQLAASDEPGREALRGVLPLLFIHDAGVLESEAAVAPAQLPKLRAAQAEIEPLRAAQLDLIANLTHDPGQLLEARHNYDKLSAVQSRLTAGFAHCARVLDALARRSECLSLTNPGDPVPTSAADSARIDSLAEQALGMPPAAAQHLATGPLRPPAEAASATGPTSAPVSSPQAGTGQRQRPLWFYLSCRRIEAWNRTIEPALNAGEISHARRLNFYRELLGLLPYELDTRLTQSARRHSKEMVDLWYFSHWSPTESERDPFARMARAGYPNPSGENLEMGRWTGEEAFWELFNSPSHHREWTDPDSTALGVGKWEHAWTEDFGAAPRLMTATPQQIARAFILGPVLKPQVTELTRRRPRDMRDIKFYDETGQQIAPPSSAVQQSRQTPSATETRPTAAAEAKGPAEKPFSPWQSAGPTSQPEASPHRQ